MIFSLIFSTSKKTDDLAFNDLTQPTLQNYVVVPLKMLMNFADESFRNFSYCIYLNCKFSEVTCFRGTPATTLKIFNKCFFFRKSCRSRVENSLSCHTFIYEPSVRKKTNIKLSLFLSVSFSSTFLPGNT